MPTAKKPTKKPTKKPAAKKQAKNRTVKAAETPPEPPPTTGWVPTDPTPVGEAPNPFSPLQWPYKKGQTVYYIASRMAVGGGGLATGTVRHYNPAVTGGLLHTKGRPVVTIDPIEGDPQSVSIRDLDDVADHTPEGRLMLEAKIRERLLADAAGYDHKAAEARREAHMLLHDPKKPKKGKQP